MANTRFHDLNLSNTTLIVTDIFLLVSLFYLSFHYLPVYYPEYFHGLKSLPLILHLFFFTLPIQLTLLAVGLYNEKLRESFSGITVRIAVAIVLAYILTFTLSIVIPPLSLPATSKLVLYASAFAVLVIARYIAISKQYEHIGRRRVLLLGCGERATLINTCMRRKKDRVHFELVGYVPFKGDKETQDRNMNKIELTVPLEQYVFENGIDEIVIALDERRNNLPTESLFHCKMQNILITDILDFVERETGQIAVNHIYPSFVIYNNHNKENIFSRIFNWLFNSALALIILAVCWPLILLTIIAIKLEDGLKSPVLYSQQRVGLRGKVFSIYKFRSMRTDAEKNGAQMATKGDSRVTRVGRIIRKYRVDELPQLFNVFRGDMCFVGPRPERPQFSEEFEHHIPYYSHRHRVKPGLTGWAQLKYPYGDGMDDAVEKLKFDLYYIKHRSLMLDILILIRTSEIVLFGRGR